MIYWVAGYPKSGNTYLIEILRGLIVKGRGRDVEYGKTIADTPLTQSTNIPNYNDVKPWDLDGGPVTPRGWVRGHLMFSRVPRLDLFEGGIYIIRHPFDVCISAFRHEMREMAGCRVEKLSDREYRTQLSNYTDVFIACVGDRAYERNGSGTWLDNVLSWVDAAKDYENLIIVRYEDLVAAPCSVFMGVVARLDGLIDIHNPKFYDAISSSCISQMRSRDKNRFIGPAKIGLWREYFTDGQIERGKEVFGDVMNDFDYQN